MGLVPRDVVHKTALKNVSSPVHFGKLAVVNHIDRWGRKWLPHCYLLFCKIINQLVSSENQGLNRINLTRIKLAFKLSFHSLIKGVLPGRYSRLCAVKPTSRGL